MKKISLVLFAFFMLLFTSCVNDDDLEKQELQDTNKISSRYVNFNEVKNNLKVLNKFNTIKEKISKTKNTSLNQNQRLIYLSQFDFSIETDDILLIEKEGYKSYTFPIYRNTEVDKTENLVITESNGLVSSYISKYDLSDSDKNNLLNNQFVDLKNKTEITSLENRGSGDPCYVIVSTPVEWNAQGQVTKSLFTAVEIECPDSDGSGGGSGGGSGDGTGDSSSGSGSGWYGSGWYGSGGTGSGDTGGSGNTGGGYTGGGYTGGIGNTGGPGPGGDGNYPGGGSTDNPPSGGNTGDPLNADPNLLDGNGNLIITSPVLTTSRAEMKLINTLTPLQYNWWIDPYNSQEIKVEIINYLNNNMSDGLIINPEALEFVSWQINYLINHPNVTLEQFKNWFLTPNEGQDFFYDANYWENPNLSFEEQDLPSWNDFYNAYPRNENGNFLTGADNVYSIVGGDVYQARINYPLATNNTCALKVSIALNDSGIVIPELIAANGLRITVKGGDDKFYFLNAKSLNNWMKETFGTNPQTTSTPLNDNHYSFTTSQDFTDSVTENSLKGIYCLILPNGYSVSGHADILLDDGTCAAGCNLSLPIDHIDVWVLD